MNKSRILGKATALAAILSLASPATADVIYDDGKPYLTAVSGFEGTPVSILGSITVPYRAISKIEWDERTNHPCYFNLLATHMNAKGVRQYTVNRCGTNGQPDGDIGSNSGFEKVWTNDAYGIYVSGIRVCMNDQDTRVKGMEIRSSVVEHDRVVAFEDWTPPDETSSSSIGGRSDKNFTTLYEGGPIAQNPNCNGNWKHWVDCRDGELPSALYLHFDDADTPASLTGVGLACREVVQKD